MIDTDSTTPSPSCLTRANGETVGPSRLRLEVAHVKLNASRAFWLVAYPTQSHEMLFDAHARA
ncbi:hypothetical protein, partial [Burkholderia ambifaria]|uniref:hypothetical protein n=1 Tax=Burkholderia ambifaria TaxID=152480 RepID=UPI001ABB53CF